MLFFISRVGGHEVAFSMKPWGGGGGGGGGGGRGETMKKGLNIFITNRLQGEKKKKRKKKLCSVTSGGNKNDR